ncbi:MAG: HEAT repeat domain-containing protein [Candidatus Wallbacteria bacterium]|nr:HEAT repeat domain-containing protein [Candidatus Wallbacteria bacterium]
MVDYKSLDEYKLDLKSKEWEKRFLALQELQFFPAYVVEDLLIGCLDDRNENVRYMAIKALGKVKSAKSIDQLIQSFADPNPLIRLQILESLGKIGDKRCVDYLIQFMQDEKDIRVRATAIMVLGQLGNKSHVPMIAIYLKDADERVRANAIEALDLIGDTEILPIISPFFRDTSNRIRANAAKTLSRFDREKSVELLRGMLKDRNEWMRASACWVLGELKEKSAIGELVAVIGDQFWVVNRNAIEALKKIGEEALPAIYKRISENKETDEHLKELIIAIGEIGNEKSLGQIVKYLQHPNGEIRLEAEAAIEKIREHT